MVTYNRIHNTMATFDRITEQSESDTITTYPISARIVETRTPSCPSVIIADSPTFRRMLFLDGELQSAEADEPIYHESLVHPVMLCSTDAGTGTGTTGAKVLVVGGGEGATVRELMRWNPSAVDWVDIDGALVNLCRVHLKWAPESVYTDPRIRFMPMDIQEALQTCCKDQYDVIILDLPDPDGETGYLYSDAFWQSIYDHLTPNGHLVTHCGPVRPWGLIGEGFQRVRHALVKNGEGDILPLFNKWLPGFYTQSIPSFQGEWGFMIASKNPEIAVSWVKNYSLLPPDLRLVDPTQLNHWKARGLLWTNALNLLT
jgi:spermidine synthase